MREFSGEISAFDLDGEDRANQSPERANNQLIHATRLAEHKSAA